MFHPFQKGRNPNFENFKKRGNLKKNFGVWESKRGRERFSKIKGGTQLFKLNLGIEKNKNGEFYGQISIDFLKNLPAAAYITFFLTFIVHIMLK